MKSRAPRCRDSVFLISVPAGWSAMPPSSSAMAAVPAERSAMTINSERLIMSRDPFRHRLHAVELRVPGHEQKESKVQNRTDFGQRRVNPRGGFQAAQAQGDE